MTCVSIPHYILGFNHSKYIETPAVFKKSQALTDGLLQFRLGGFHLYKKTKHFASMNIISVSDPRVLQDDTLPIKCLTLPDVKKAEEFTALHSDVCSPSHRRTISDYEALIVSIYPNLETFEDEGKQTRCSRFWVIDIECVDYSMQTLVFINEADAKSAVEMIRSAM